MEKEKEMQSLTEQLQQMAAVDIRTVDASELVNISDIKIDMTLPKDERVKEYIRQVKNPYVFLIDGMKVKISFAGKRRLEDCLKDCLFGQE